MSQSIQPASETTEPNSQDIGSLYRQVIRAKGRVEIEGPDGPCVIMSKAELESIEQALDIMAQREEFKAAVQSLAQVAARCA